MERRGRAGQGLVRDVSTQVRSACISFDRDSTPRYSIGALAEHLSVSIAWIRSWGEQGLLPLAAASGQSAYGALELARGRVLRRLRESGWTSARLARAVAAAMRFVGDVDEVLAGLGAVAADQFGAMRLADGRLVMPDGQGLLFGSHRSSSGPAIRPLRSPGQWVQQAMEAEAAGRLEEAISAYERALPEAGVEALFNLGNCRYQAGLLIGAYDALQAAVALDPHYVEAWNNLGIARSALGRSEDAVQAFHRALGLRPHYADAHFNLADVLASQGDLEGACEHWRAYLTFDPNSRWAEQVRSRLRAIECGVS
ncbi:MAG: tetratricopeptide repeat protein [Planctomycetota bacterium]|nr:tetratricopeptide repeat protein [Planctomycetota bacterium]